MASITKLWVTNHTSRLTGISQTEHSVTWRAEASHKLSCDHVLVLAQSVSSSSDIEPVPVSYYPMLWDGDVSSGGGRVEAELGSGTLPTALEIVVWLAGGPGRYADGGAYALDFSIQQVGNNKLYDINVIYRAPDPAQQESLNFVNQFLNLGSTIPLLTSGNAGTPNIDDVNASYGKDANGDIFRPVEMWIEYQHTTRRTREAFSRFDIPLPPLELANGEPFWLEVEDTNEIIVLERNVSNPLEASALNELYSNTTNLTALKVGTATEGLFIPRNTLRYIRSETGRRMSQGNVNYYVMQTRIERIKGNLLERIPQWGTFSITRDASGRVKRLWPQDEDGHPVDRVPLKPDGSESFFWPADQAFLEFKRLRAEDFRPLFDSVVF